MLGEYRNLGIRHSSIALHGHGKGFWQGEVGKAISSGDLRAFKWKSGTRL